MKPAPSPHSRFTVPLLLALALILVLGLLCLPMIQFNSSLYSKRSPNTFVGDEKYLQIRGEVEQVLAQYKEQGVSGTIEEQVIERVNSKGVTTSLVVFSISAADSRTGWDILRSDLPTAHLLRLQLILLSLSLLLSVAASLFFQSPVSLSHRLPGILSFVFSLVSIAITPLLYMTLNLSLSRSVDLILAGQPVANQDALLSAIDALLFGGHSGETLQTLLSSLTYRISPAIWLCALPCFMVLCASILSLNLNLRHVLLRILLYVSVILFSLFILYPFFVMFITAFRSNSETTDMHFLHILPTKWVFSNLKDTLDRGVLRYLINSLLIAGGATCISMLCGIPAAYAMARMSFRGRKAYLGFVIMSQMFSPVVLLVGISRLMNTLHLNDSLLGLMLINAAFNQAFAIWLLRGTFVSISSEMEQAATIDGCTTVGALIRILLPMAAPGIVTTLIFIFINAWNEYTISTVLISTQTNRPITVGITQFSSFNMIEWQYLFAAALLATVPVVILFMFIEKHLAAGLTSGGVKG